MVKTANQNIRLSNRRLILAAMRGGECFDVANLSTLTNLSKMTVHKVLDHYVDMGLVAPAGKGDAVGEVGKKPNLFRLNLRHRLIFSAQIFENSLLAAVTDLGATILAHRQMPFEKDTLLGDILDLARTAYDDMCAELKARTKSFAAVVLGASGVTDADEGIIHTSSHFASWGTRVPVREMLRARFPAIPRHHVDNWIRYQAYAELKLGAGRTCDRFMVIGTEADGVSAGLVEDGRLQHGRKGLAGEIGHMQVRFDSDEECACGGRGCLEPTVSLLRMQERVAAQAVRRPESSLFAEAGGNAITYHDIFRHADAGDALCREALDEVSAYMAMAINNAVQVFEPELVVIQGEFAAAGTYFLQRLRDRCGSISLTAMDKGTEILYSSLGREGVLGAAYYSADTFFAEVE
ncbi:MAG: ROK family protein [Planctomycetaceae bacterium]|nr:ROK family protein [Planctomycetaceae bacterium]